MPNRWLGLAGLVIVLDQLTKSAITARLVLGEVVELTPFFGLTLAHNRGAAFSFLNDADGWQRWLFSAIAVIASVWIVALLRKHNEQKLFCAALALILGGALGNLIDRMAYGHVVDFLLFHWQEHYFPAFNVADSGITVGAALMLWDSFKNPKEKT
jgi:signal peptidase II